MKNWKERGGVHTLQWDRVLPWQLPGVTGGNHDNVEEYMGLHDREINCKEFRRLRSWWWWWWWW